jgi:hypothetical protein
MLIAVADWLRANTRSARWQCICASADTKTPRHEQKLHGTNICFIFLENINKQDARSALTSGRWIGHRPHPTTQWRFKMADILALKQFKPPNFILNKTLYRALTRWGYTNTHIKYISTQLFQLRFKVVPELSWKVEYERERLFNTVLKCGALQIKLPAFRLRLQVKLYLVHFRFVLLSAASWSIRKDLINCALKLQKKIFWVFRAQNTIKMKKEVRRIHWYTAEEEKTNDTRVIKDLSETVLFLLY